MSRKVCETRSVHDSGYNRLRRAMILPSRRLGSKTHPLTEALTAHVDAVLADETSGVGADAAVVVGSDSQLMARVERFGDVL